MRVKDAVTNQHRKVLSLPDSYSVADAIAKMTATGKNALIITANQQPAGLFSRNDLMKAIANVPGKSFETIRLKEVVTADFIQVEFRDDLASTVGAMLKAEIEYLSVCENSEVRAIVPIRDLLTSHIEALESEIEQLNDYITQLHDSLHD